MNSQFLLFHPQCLAECIYSECIYKFVDVISWSTTFNLLSIYLFTLVTALGEMQLQEKSKKVNCGT